ncbi:hypothetical protein ACLB2K_067581 [Fragaria x ananassa]
MIILLSKKRHSVPFVWRILLLLLLSATLLCCPAHTIIMYIALSSGWRLATYVLCADMQCQSKMMITPIDRLEPMNFPKLKELSIMVCSGGIGVEQGNDNGVSADEDSGAELGLESLCLSGIGGVEEVELRTCRSILDGVLLKLAENCDALTSLLIYDGGSREGLLRPKGTGTAVNSGLEELALINCDVVEREPGLLSTSGQKLKKLGNWICRTMMLLDKEFMSMLVSCNYLVDLKLRRVQVEQSKILQRHGRRISLLKLLLDSLVFMLINVSNETGIAVAHGFGKRTPTLVCNAVYGAEEGDTCGSVAQTFSLSLQSFLAINPNINCKSFFVGQWLCIDGATK